MAEEKEEILESEDSEAQELAKKKAKKKKAFMILGIIAAAIIFVIVYSVFLKKPNLQEENNNSHNTGSKHSAEAKHEDNPNSPEVVEDVYYDLDNFVINLNSTAGRSRFLKMTITLHIKSDVNVNIISKKIPIIRDNFQFYLRELRPADLEGSKEMTIVKEELLLRINKILYPIVVQDLLFKEILVN